MESLEVLSKEQRDDEKIVRQHIEKLGVDQFKFASERLRSDAKFILSMVEKHPQILEHAEEKIFERYMKGKEQICLPAEDNLLFAIECCTENLEAFKYINDNLAVKFYESVKAGYVEKGEFLGANIRFIGYGEKKEEVVNKLEEMRPEVAKSLEI